MEKQKIFQFIDSSSALVIGLEREMCARPAVSPSQGGTGELDKALYLGEFLKKNGITDIERIDAPDPLTKGGVRPNMIATVAGEKPETGSEKRLWLVSHLDVVPTGDLSLWKSDPFVLKVDGDVLTGRGVEDNQQGICSSIIAALSFVKNGIVPKKTLKLAFVSDEECGSAFGIAHVLAARGKGLFEEGDFALIPDSGNPDASEIEVAEKNLLWLKVSVEGKQSHGSRPDLGINARTAGNELGLRLHEELGRKFAMRDALFTPPVSTFELTAALANVPNVNTIPGLDVFYMDMRFLPSYPVKEVFDFAQKIKLEVEKKHGVKITYESVQEQESPATPSDSPLVTELKKHIENVIGTRAKAIGIGGGTVAAHLRRARVDSVVWAKLGETAHQANESALLSNILAEAKVIASLAL